MFLSQNDVSISVSLFPLFARSLKKNSIKKNTQATYFPYYIESLQYKMVDTGWHTKTLIFDC